MLDVGSRRVKEMDRKVLGRLPGPFSDLTYNKYAYKIVMGQNLPFLVKNTAGLADLQVRGSIASALPR